MIQTRTPAEQLAWDRATFDGYSLAARRMRSNARANLAVAASLVEDPDLLTFAAPVLAHTRRIYEQLAELLTLAADQAMEIADDAKRYIGRAS